MNSVGLILLALLLGSGMTIQLFVLPPLLTRTGERSAMSRICSDLLKKHHTLSVFLLIPACLFLYLSGKIPATAIAAVLLVLNMYQRFWIGTKIHLVKQPIGVQDLIQPDNALRDEFNRLQKRLYFLFRIHLLLLLIALIIAAF